MSAARQSTEQTIDFELTSSESIMVLQNCALAATTAREHGKKLLERVDHTYVKRLAEQVITNTN